MARTPLRVHATPHALTLLRSRLLELGCTRQKDFASRWDDVAIQFGKRFKFKTIVQQLSRLFAGVTAGLRFFFKPDDDRLAITARVLGWTVQQVQALLVWRPAAEVSYARGDA